MVSKKIMKQKREPYRDYVKDINQAMDVFSEGSQHGCASTWSLSKGSRETNPKLKGRRFLHGGRTPGRQETGKTE